MSCFCLALWLLLLPWLLRLLGLLKLLELWLPRLWLLRLWLLKLWLLKLLELLGLRLRGLCFHKVVHFGVKSQKTLKLRKLGPTFSQSLVKGFPARISGFCGF